MADHIYKTSSLSTEPTKDITLQVDVEPIFFLFKR